MSLLRSLGSFITDVYRETVDFTLVGASGYAATAATPAGTLRVITNIAAVNNDANGGRAFIDIYDGTTSTWLKHVAATVRRVSIDWTGFLVLKEGEYIRYGAWVVQAGDLLRLRVVGHDIRSEDT